MKPTAIRIIVGVLPAMALFATPAFAQDTIQTQTTPPPVPVSAAPAAAAPAAAGPSSEDQARYQASLDAATKRTANASDASPAAARSSAAGRPLLATRPTPQRAAAPVAAAAGPVAAPTEAPVEANPPVSTPSAAPAPVETSAPVAATADTSTTQTTTNNSSPTWAYLLSGLAVIAAIAGALMLLRRRREDAYVEEWSEQPDPIVQAEPAFAAPLTDEPVVEHADVVTAEAAEVAAMTEGAAPVAGRPWIELSLRPVRAGATDESALVDLELTLANAGQVEATNVRVSTFMIGDATGAPSSMEQLLATGHHGAEVDAGQIAAGEGSRIDARVAVPRDGMDGATFQPLVGVDVRYTLPNGQEGRTAAAFTVGVHDDTEDPTPLRLGGDIREDVSATLHGVPERV